MHLISKSVTFLCTLNRWTRGLSSKNFRSLILRSKLHLRLNIDCTGFNNIDLVHEESEKIIFNAIVELFCFEVRLIQFCKKNLIF